LSQTTMSDVRPRLVGKGSRVFLLVLSEINLVLGAFFFVNPDAAIALWPWPVKALAVRFLGAVFLAITLGCWSALRVKEWQRGKILVLVGAVFFGLTFLITAGVGLSPTAGFGVWAWAGYFLAATLGLVVFSDNMVGTEGHRTGLDPRRLGYWLGRSFEYRQPR